MHLALAACLPSGDIFNPALLLVEISRGLDVPRSLAVGTTIIAVLMVAIDRDRGSSGE
jgi:hypothetical protein